MSLRSEIIKIIQNYEIFPVNDKPYNICEIYNKVIPNLPDQVKKRDNGNYIPIQNIEKSIREVIESANGRTYHDSSTDKDITIKPIRNVTPCIHKNLSEPTNYIFGKNY